MSRVIPTANRKFAMAETVYRLSGCWERGVRTPTAQWPWEWEDCGMQQSKNAVDAVEDIGMAEYRAQRRVRGSGGRNARSFGLGSLIWQRLQSDRYAQITPGKRVDVVV